MNGKVHVAIGAGSLAVLCVKYPGGFEFANTHIVPVIGLVTASFGSYLPDIDQGRTHMGMKHKHISKAVNKVGGGHRGITHTLLFPAIFIGLMYFVSNYLADLYYIQSVVGSLLFGMIYGYCMHIAADMFNGKGVPLFWPIIKRKIHFMDLPSSGFIPWVFAVVVVGGFALITLGGVFG